MTPRDRGLSAPMIDEVFDLLGDWRRRAVCRYFASTGVRSSHVDPLSTAVARRAPVSGLEVSVSGEAAVRRALVDEHLPRLDQAAVLDFDARSESVRYHGHPTVEKWAEHAEAVTER